MSSQIVGAPDGAPTMYGLMVRSHNHVEAKLGAVLQAELADLVGARTKSQQLVGSSSYTVNFVKGQLPPVKGFWSVTMYDPEHYFYQNPLKRFALGTKNKSLKYGDDGSLTIYLGNKSPAKTKNRTGCQRRSEICRFGSACNSGCAVATDPAKSGTTTLCNHNLLELSFRHDSAATQIRMGELTHTVRPPNMNRGKEVRYEFIEESWASFWGADAIDRIRCAAQSTGGAH